MSLSKKVLISCLALAWVVPAPAASVADVLQQCATIARDLDRLECYDKLAANPGKALQETVVPAPSTAAAGESSVAGQAMPAGEDAFGMEMEMARQTPDAIESTIVGEFNGWDGKTVFTLANGQVWKQSNPGKVVYHAVNPRVTITKGVFGSYRLNVEGLNASVAVRRIK
jgi:hypothetical protein